MVPLDSPSKPGKRVERRAEESLAVASADVSPEDVEATARAAERVSWLIHVNDELRQKLTLTQLLSEMLLRLCEVVEPPAVSCGSTTATERDRWRWPGRVATIAVFHR